VVPAEKIGHIDFISLEIVSTGISTANS